MNQEMFVVNASIVDANGAYHVMDGYPMVVKSTQYGNDIKKAKKRAEGLYSEAVGVFAKRDDRIMQHVDVVQVSNGAMILNWNDGGLPNIETEEE